MVLQKGRNVQGKPLWEFVVDFPHVYVVVSVCRNFSFDYERYFYEKKNGCATNNLI